MRSFASSVECLYDRKAVFGVDLQELDQHEADRPSFAGRAHLDAGPQLAIDVPQRVVDRFGLRVSAHKSQSWKASTITRQCAASDRDHQVIAGLGAA
jgi:hypothetical protein